MLSFSLSNSSFLHSYIAIHVKKIKDSEVVCVTLSIKMTVLSFISMLLLTRMFPSH